MEPDDQPSSIPYVRVIGKAVTILEALATDGDETSLAEICRRARLNRSTAYRILGTLERHALVGRGDRGGYRLGIKLFELGSAAQRGLGLRRVALPHLRSLAEQLAVSTFLSIRDRDQAVCVERVDRGAIQIATYQVGTTLPLTAGAAPFILLASLDDAEIDRILQEDLPSLTPKTVTDPAVVRARIRRVRAEGLVWSDEDVAPTMGAFGCPIVGPTGGTIAALSVATLAADLLGEGRARLTRRALATAERISRDGGYSGPWPCVPLPSAAT